MEYRLLILEEYCIDCVQLATIFWTGFAHFPGQLTATRVYKLPHTRAFYPTVDRSWLIDFWNLEAKWVFVALPIGFLLMLLFYYDHVGALPGWALEGIELNEKSESKQCRCSSQTISSKETRRISLGLLSSWLHKLHRRYYWYTASEWLDTTSSRAHRLIDSISR